VFVRKTNKDNYASALEQARSRFEDSLKVEKTENTKNLNEYRQYMDETNKFLELKALKDA